MNKPIVVSFLTGIALVTGIFIAEARPEYARKENKKCSFCHINPAGGGARSFRGQFYGANDLSFAKFDEAREASIAGVQPDIGGRDSAAKVGYVGAVSGPSGVAVKQIQLASLRSPVLAVFFDSAGDDSKAAAKLLRKLALAYERTAVVVGVMVGDADRALKMSTALGSLIRILPDPTGEAAKKFGATRGFDMVVVSQRGDTFKLISGLSRSTLEGAVAQLGVFGVQAPSVDVSDAPAKEWHGGKIGS